MKKLLASLLLLFTFPLEVNAIVGYSPVVLYGFTNDRAMWEPDTIDANDTDLVSDVSWFYKEPLTGLTLPHEIDIGSQSKFNQIIFSVGNSPLDGLPHLTFATLRFSYPRLTPLNNYEYVPLEVKDLDGGFSRSNRTYRYSFATPGDWLSMSPHVQVPSTYFVKVECLKNCASQDLANNAFQINEVNIRVDSIIRPLGGGICTLQPFRPECVNMRI